MTMETIYPKNPKVSVVIPTLNEEKHIGDLLLSLKNQSFKDFEIIVVDGGSSDNTVNIARKFNAQTIIKLGLKEFPSRNEGAKVASGEILLFTGADVIMLPGALKKVVNEFEKNNLDGLCAFGGLRDAPMWGEFEYYLHYSLLHLWIRVTGDLHGSTNFMAVKKERFIETDGFSDRIDGDGFFLNTFARDRKVGFLRGTKYFFASGRRMRKMGFLSFNTHFLYMVDIFLPFLRDSTLIKLLERKSMEFRGSHTKEFTKTF